ncbi:uncharacterized protein LOC115747665 [Rhodamnia argentea]|uniref:Uncharacterized protein LOC115747665 n=1 Tax=Rhodamnia argentea TaxID=178133 RepID=A0A8B8PY79_9MYRT|nr:uncharacterized protein LOC115747665 [Rhodamnia argentea]XP_030539761.1 uncharacterized protein LOC115747665 [Rhodamnia argentea]XP_048127892.1 uncharacterized protein LOC115747665 [Rhodamnia argentea]XP_048127893.1 uncharacterized protein LOC115747665 [Rhodamnia argentea]
MELVMVGKGAGSLRKRMKPDVEEKEEDPGHNAIAEIVEKEETEANVGGSEEMELHITHILDKIESFTQLVSELLESGKTMFKELSDEFEERLIMIHKEQMEKWQNEIKEIRLLDASNEEVNATLHNARYLLQNPHVDS